MTATVSFASAIANNPARKGQLAAPKQFFGDFNRFAVAPMHTRFETIEWFVWDADHPDSDMSHAEVGRQSATLEDALAGL